MSVWYFLDSSCARNEMHDISSFTILCQLPFYTDDIMIYAKPMYPLFLPQVTGRFPQDLRLKMRALERDFTLDLELNP